VPPLWQIVRMRTSNSPTEPTPGLSDREEGGGRPAVALAVLVTSWAIAVAAIGLAWANRDAAPAEIWFFVVDVADALIYGAVAWLLLSRVRHPVAWIIALTAVGGAVAALGMQWSVFVMERPDLPPLSLLASAVSWAWIPGTIALITVVPWLLRDDRLGTLGRVAIGAGIVVIASLVVAPLTDPWPWPDGDPTAPFAVRSEWWAQLVYTSYPRQMTAVVLLGLLATADVARRWATLGTERRRGLGWLAIGVGLLSLSFVPVAAINSFGADMATVFTPVTHLASQAFFPGAILVVVLGQRLWGVDLAVSRALVWLLLSGGLVAAYVTLVVVATRLLPFDEGVAQVAATAVVAAGFHPARVWLQRRVDALVHGQGREPLLVLRGVTGPLGVADTPHQLLDEVAGSVRSSLRLHLVLVVAGVEHRGRILASSGPALTDLAPELLADAADVELVAQGERIGSLVAVPRPGERLDARSTDSLRNLAPIVAASVQLAETSSALVASRRRLAAARDADRRALRRELHDGLGPALAGTGLALQAGLNLLVSDPVAGAELIDRVAAELDQRVQEVREMARGLVPPSLDGDGLGAALEELAERTRLGGLTVDVQLDTLPAMSPAAASALYAIAAEAVRNVVRHADASRCTVSVAADPRAVRLEVHDDGVGLSDADVAGVGRTSMREWAVELGGDVDIAASPEGGAAVTAWVPTTSVLDQSGMP
jgi:signal transduction histidine kinase